MPTKKQLDEENKQLKHDKAFGILTRPGLEVEQRKNTSATYVIFLDLDKIHRLNDRLGHSRVNTLVRRSIHIRHADIVISGRWYSGDELVILIKGDPEAVCKRLQESLSHNGLSATIAYSHLTRNFSNSVYRAKKKVDASKKKNRRGIIVR